jgi:hypothetical protein
VFFVDDAFRTPDELVWGEDSPLVRRRLRDGNEYTVVKVPYDPAALERRLARLGWRITVRPASPPFFWGEGTHSARVRKFGSESASGWA